MMKLGLSYYLGLFIAVLSLALRLTAPTAVLAQQLEWTGTCVGAPVSTAPTPVPPGGQPDPNEAMAGVATIQGLECLIANVFSVFLTLLGLSGFVMMIIGSFRWLVSGGNTKGTETARNTFTFMGVGIVVAVSAFIVLRLVADFTGVQTIMEFRIPNSNTTY